MKYFFFVLNLSKISFINIYLVTIVKTGMYVFSRCICFSFRIQDFRVSPSPNRFERNESVAPLAYPYHQNIRSEELKLGGPKQKCFYTKYKIERMLSEGDGRVRLIFGIFI